jgi:hypothetical protein
VQRSAATFPTEVAIKVAVVVVAEGVVVVKARVSVLSSVAIA